MNSILFCGDVMPGGVLPYQQEYISGDLLDYLKSFDLRVGTLEAAIGTNLEYDTTKVNGRQNIIYARDEDFYRVVEMGFDVVSLANNHVFDLGEDGLKNTIKHLNDNGIKYCGAGMNIEEASKPAVVEYKGKKIAFLAYCDYDMDTIGYVPIATNDSCGVNPFNVKKAVIDIQKCKTECEYVFVLPHWGKEYCNFPTYKAKKASIAMIEAGADGVVASHTHRPQPHILHKNKPIYFGLGNFIFPDFYMTPPRPIWYPTTGKDMLPSKITLDYPFPINESLKRVWRETSRVGMVAEIYCSDGIKSKYSFVYLSKQNVLNRVLDKSLEKRLKMIGRYIKMPFYDGGKCLLSIASIFFMLRKKIKIRKPYYNG